MTTERDQFIFALCVMLMILIAGSLLAAVAILYLDYNKSDLQPVCDSTHGVAMWLYDEQYVRDLTRVERLRYCPRWTVTPITPQPTIQYTPNVKPGSNP